MIVVSNNIESTICRQGGVSLSFSLSLFLCFFPTLFDFISTLSGSLAGSWIKTKHFKGDRRWSVAKFYPPFSSLCPPHTPSSSPPGPFPTHPLLSAQWKSLITGGESNPWHWMKDEGLPPSLSFSQSLSLSSFFPWMLVMLGRFSLPLVPPLPLSVYPVSLFLCLSLFYSSASRLFLHSFIPLFSPGYSLEEEASTVQTGVRENKAGSLEEVKVALQL